MLTYPDINPIALQIGPLAIHWYGVMYLIGFFSFWSVLALRIRASKRTDFTVPQLSDLLFYGALGVIIGGRLGYVFFYDFTNTINHPLNIFKIWQGGMSFHGGLIGVVVALWIYTRHIGKSFGDVMDFIAPAVPLGLAAGRMGNFINGELWGRVTDMPWGMVFPRGGNLPRHPSQLYEFFLEGIVLFIVLWLFSQKPKPRWAVSGLFLMLYGIFRFLIEFFREPDPQIGYIAFGWLTKGQLLSLPMLIGGAGLFLWAYYINDIKDKR